MLKKYALIPLKTKLFVLLAVLFVSGVAVGAKVSAENSKLFLLLLDGYSGAQTAESAAENFFFALSSDFVMFGAVFLLGFSAVASPIILLVPFFKGLGVGASVGAMYLSSPPFGEVVRFFAGFALTTAVSVYALIFASLSSLKMSSRLFASLTAADEGPGLKPVAASYCLKFLLFAAIILINAVADTLLSVLLFG